MPCRDQLRPRDYDYNNEISRGPTEVPAREDRFPGFWVISPEIPLHQEDRVYTGHLSAGRSVVIEGIARRARTRATRRCAAARMVRARLCCLFLLLGPGATLAFQMSAPRGARAGHHLPNERRCCAAHCTVPEPAERTPETADNARERKEEDTALAADLLSEPADNRETEEFTLVAGAKELQRPSHRRFWPSSGRCYAGVWRRELLGR